MTERIMKRTSVFAVLALALTVPAKAKKTRLTSKHPGACSQPTSTPYSKSRVRRKNNYQQENRNWTSQ